MNNETTTTTSTALVPLAMPTDVTVFGESDFAIEEWGRVQDLASAVDASDSNLLLTYGAKPQREVSSVFDTLLREIRTEEAGVGGDLVVELARGMEEAKIREMREELEKGGSRLAYFLNRIPLIGPWIAQKISAFLYFKHRKEAIIGHFDAMERRIAAKKEELLAANTSLDMSYEATEKNLMDLKIYIAAGEQAGRRLVDESKTRLEAAQTTKDPVVVNQYRDFRGSVEAFLTRIVRLHTAYANSAQNLPQVRMIQETTKIALADVVDTLLVDIPQMKQAILQLTALKTIRDARAGAEQRREISRELRELTANTANESYLEAKSSQGRFEDELALLENMAAKLKETEKLARDIEQQNAAARADAHQRLAKVTEELAEIQATA
jgi:uncharacterized protein YaaN involved in tellurite resistance